MANIVFVLKKLIMPIRPTSHVLLAGDSNFSENMKKELLEECSNINISTMFNSNESYDYIFIFEHSTVNSRRILKNISIYLSPLFETDHKFMQIYNHCTQNNECLVIDMNSKNIIEKSVYWYSPKFTANQ